MVAAGLLAAASAVSKQRVTQLARAQHDRHHLRLRELSTCTIVPRELPLYTLSLSFRDRSRTSNQVSYSFIDSASFGSERKSTDRERLPIAMSRGMAGLDDMFTARQEESEALRRSWTNECPTESWNHLLSALSICSCLQSAFRSYLAILFSGLLRCRRALSPLKSASRD